MIFIALAALVLLALVMPGLTFWQTTGDVSVYFDYEVLPGQFPYVMSKLAGLYAIVFLWLQSLLGLAGRPLARRMRVGSLLPAHRALGIATLVLIATHVLLFITAISIRNKLPALDLLLPSLQGYYRTMLSVGLLGTWLIVATALAAGLRRRAKSWRLAHRLAVPAFLLLFVHSYLVGSESRAGAMGAFYLFMLAVWCAALALRVFESRRALAAF